MVGLKPEDLNKEFERMKKGSPGLTKKDFGKILESRVKSEKRKIDKGKNVSTDALAKAEVKSKAFAQLEKSRLSTEEREESSLASEKKRIDEEAHRNVAKQLSYATGGHGNISETRKYVTQDMKDREKKQLIVGPDGKITRKLDRNDPGVVRAAVKSARKERQKETGSGFSDSELSPERIKKHIGIELARAKKKRAESVPGAIPGKESDIRQEPIAPVMLAEGKRPRQDAGVNTARRFGGAAKILTARDSQKGNIRGTEDSEKDHQEKMQSLASSSGNSLKDLGVKMDLMNEKLTKIETFNKETAGNTSQLSG